MIAGHSLRAAALTALLLAAGCASVPPDQTPLPAGWTPAAIATGSVTDCRRLYRYVADRVAAAGRGDAQAARIPGFDYLRADRFSASFADDELTGSAFDAWLDLLQALAQAGLTAELAALGDSAGLPSMAALEACAATLRADDFTGPRVAASARALRERIAVPDAYRDARRAAGLYWLTAWPVKASIAALHARLRRDHAAATTLPATRWRPPADASLLAPGQVADILGRAYAGNDLGVPRLARADRERLFDTFAPLLAIDPRSDDDRIGAPFWPANSSVPAVDTRRPAAYRHVSWTRYQGEVLLQLNYVFWFPARPARRAFDYLAGALDGITWRVTLARDGRPLAYDAMHNCGCYHLFFPTPRSCIKADQGVLQEPAFSYQEIDAGHGRLALALSPVEHFIERVSPTPAAGDGAYYEFRDYDELRALPAPDGARSLFGADGIVPGTQRGERFLLWPMGVPSPGAMRQFGHHATAFIGRRHFDDPDLIARSFAPRPPAGCPLPD